MSMHDFLQTGRVASRRNTQASSSASSSSRVTHHARSRRLEKSKSLLSLPSSQEGLHAPSVDGQSKEYPDDASVNTGAVFPIEWDNIWLGSKKLSPELLGYRVKHLSQMRGNRRPSPVWRHGAELLYTGDGQRVKVWLCRLCHGQGLRGAAKIVDGYNHINAHLQKEHRIDIAGGGGLLPDPSRPPANPWEAAATVAGSARVVNHSAWQEESLQSALVDWVILHDQSFAHASSAELRGLLTWNRLDLLNALPSSRATISSYVTQGLEQRKREIRMILRMAPSKIALSVDIWTSPNHLSFLGVVAHFIGMYLGLIA